MRLLVSTIPYDKGKSGISVYVREVVRELAAQGHSLAILCEDSEVVKQLGSEVVKQLDSDVVKQFSSEVVDETPLNHLTTQPPNHLTTEPPNHPTTQPPNHLTTEPPNHHAIQAPRWTRRPVASMLWHLFVLPFWIRRHRREFDGFVICAANRRVCAWYPLPTTATVHDLANFHIPGKYSRSRMFYLAHILPHYAKKAQHLVAVSEATKTDMVKFWHCREEDVTVLYNGLVVKQLGSEVVKQFSSDVVRQLGSEVVKQLDSEVVNQLDSEVVEETPPNHLTTQPPNHQTLLYISRIEHPGKNHVRLIEAYSRLPRSLAEAHPLVIAGADWKDAEVVHEAAAKSPHADLIRFTGFVANEDMPHLWEEAGFYVFPSRFEGFGLSLVEAMAKGIPCACSNNGSLGEIAADVAITFDPESVDEIADALRRLLSEPETERAARIARGLEHVKKFSWSDHAKGIAELISGRDGSERVSRLFGIPVARVTQSEAVDRIISFAKRGGKAAFVATLNVDFVANAVSGWPFGGNDELWGYLRNADFVTADGMPIVLLSRILRRGLPARVTGADMVPAICRRCAEEGLKVYVLGGDKDAVSDAFKRLLLTTQSPNHLTTILAGHDDAFVKLDEQQPEIVERINAAKPDILFVALGNPKQELWMGRNASKLNVGAMVGIGGTFNFIAGKVKRAPKWMQKSGLEWIYRIIQEPGRLWRRYAYGLVKFSWLSLLHVLGGYRR